MVDVRALEQSDLAAASSLLDAELGGRQQARLGVLHDVLAVRGVGAWDADQLVGVATYDIDGERAELAAIAVRSDRRLAGVGSRLIAAVADATAGAGVRELWLVTTNDNLDALRLYQQRGFELTELHRGAVHQARGLKPAIPELGNYGIPIRDELVLTLPLS
ncbi:MAG TPA: GNAT family N-acetyltransferase [Acidimicrobiales bacterium]|jgi:ribosomal protein S18 acetylase RimI-like enzyme|nr:GNAT family N-acetyltransferase [Acidimicrobiales bacterium]